MAGRILIIDDNQVIVELLQRKLTREGYEALGCMESYRAVDMCLESKPDLVILDILMPGKSGWDIMAELKQNPETESIPVIVSTVKNRPDDVERSIELKAADYIAKPYVFGDLLEKIKGLMGAT